ncbi:MAG: carbohydrate binding family 9 domain-containing protein [Bacteroidales bacterium]|nr:carbohydrate binding family 9 domain-containing protein [Bacteroidales bacterium]
MKTFMKLLITSAILILLVTSVSSGQTPVKKQFKATQISTPPAIDGILDEDIWQSGSWVDDFIQYEPYNGSKSSQKTGFTILFDEDNLYVAFKAYDTNPDSIVNRLTRRDDADGEQVAIIIDSFHDLRTGFLFGVSSAGVKFDQMFTDDGQDQDASWDPNWWVKTSLNNEGWVAEMKIPFNQLRFDKNSGDVWGLEMYRKLYRKNETSLWQHIPKDAPGLIHLFGDLDGLEKIKPHKILDITPYGVAQAETFKAEPDNPFTKDGKKFGLNGGIDAKIGVTNNMTMDLTINPDFGQVEADPSEVNLTAYETFFAEKRPFFIEGNNITNFNIGVGDGNVGNDNLFYSRRIGRNPHGDPDLEEGWHSDVPKFTPILGAAKLTGKTKDGLSVGFVEAVTSEVEARVDTAGGRISENVEPLTNYLVGRVQRDFKEGNTILGGIFTSTNRNLDDNLASFMHKSAYTGGLDFTQYFRDKKWMFNLNAAMSQVNGTKDALKNTQMSSARYYQRPDNDYTRFDTTRTSLTGSGGRMQIQKLDGHFNMMGVISWKTPGFETNDIGYLREADQILSVFWVGYHQWNPKGIYRNYNINTDVYALNNFGGDLTGKGFEFNMNMTLKNFWEVQIGGNLEGSNLSNGKLRGGSMMKLPGDINVFGWISTDRRKKLVTEFSFQTLKGFQNNSSGYNCKMELEYKPTNFISFNISPAYSKSFNDLQYVTKVTYNGNDKYIFASINQKTLSASLRANLNVSPDLTLQYWGQPFISSGKYYDHKYIIDPLANEYSDRFHTYSIGEITYDTDHYNIDQNADSNSDYTIDNKSFNVQEFLSNLVIRWEYNPGSTIYLVWSQTRSYSGKIGTMDVFDNLGDLFDKDNNTPHNMFLIKFSYRFSLN